MTSAPFYPNDVDHLLGLTELTMSDYEALWDLAARIAARLAPADLAWFFGTWIKALTKEEAVRPLEALLRGLIRHGDAERLAHVDPVDLEPMLVSDHPTIKLLALDFLSGLPVAAEG
jgi:hypothetical protein